MRSRTALVVAVLSGCQVAYAHAQCPDGSVPPCRSTKAPSLRAVPNEQGRLTATYEEATLRTIRMDLARLTKRMIVASRAADTIRITAQVDDTRWDVALKAMLDANGLEGVEDTNGVILIRTQAEFAAQEARQPVITRTVILKRPATVVAQLARVRLSAVGVMDVDTTNNSLIVTERAALLEPLMAFILTLDTLPSQKKPNP